ncbi:DinB superfamily protein [Friedmanniella luteola]|uniref:DinB superfamily protein n=1 Tax=Friedmanniella luteola TaxID=546871 RepID=A0A1H1XQ09_9ACTN|nr:DinB family protein [Friedmanniella luteola]SDT10889.1 DinB superfamily protein [Friedmanniella luteola]
MDVAAVSQEMEEARVTFHALVRHATATDLRLRTAGTRWTNRQLLFHMVFGYLVVRTLRPFVRGFGRLPITWSRRFSAALHAVRRPYHLVNYLGSCVGGTLLSPSQSAALLDRAIAVLRHGLATETEQDLARRMAFPVSWDPYFRDTMSLLDVYHFGTQHFEHHRRQLTLDDQPR